MQADQSPWSSAPGMIGRQSSGLTRKMPERINVPDLEYSQVTHCSPVKFELMFGNSQMTSSSYGEIHKERDLD